MSRSYVTHWRDAIADSQLSSTQKLIAHTLSTWMSSNGHCYPGQEEIARRASLTDTSVRVATHALESAGFLRVEWSRGRGSHGYQALIPETGSGITANLLRGSGRANPEPRFSNPEADTSQPRSSFGRKRESAESGAGGARAANCGAPPACRECGIGGNQHAADCPQALIGEPPASPSRGWW
jgi:hypothetical protein